MKEKLPEINQELRILLQQIPGMSEMFRAYLDIRRLQEEKNNG